MKHRGALSLSLPFRCAFLFALEWGLGTERWWGEKGVGEGDEGVEKGTEGGKKFIPPQSGM